MDRLPVFKALGDNTRYAIYLELARASRPLSTADIADALELHPNTVRPHLDRMRDVGLLEVDADSRGTVGRPQHRYRLAGVVASTGADSEVVADIGRMQGQVAAVARADAESCIDALMAELAELG